MLSGVLSLTLYTLELMKAIMAAVMVVVVSLYPWQMNTCQRFIKIKRKKRIPTFPHEHIRKYPSPEPLYYMPTQMGDGCALKASNE